MKTARVLLSVCLCLSIEYPLVIANSIAPAVAQSNSARQAEAAKLNREGEELADRGDLQAALVKYQQALDLVREIKDRLNEALVLSNICLAYFQSGQMNPALDNCQKSLIISKEIGDRQEISGRLTEIGVIYSSIGKYPQAIESFEQALVIYRELKDKKEVKALYNLASVYLAQGNSTKAIELLEQTIKLSRANGNRLYEGRSLSGLAVIYQGRGEYTQALELFQQAKNIAEAIDDKLALGAILSNIGNNYAFQSDYEQALKYFTKSIDVFQLIGNQRQLSITLNNQGSAYEYLGRYPQALLAYNSALKIAQSTDNRSQEGVTLSNIGGLYQSLGQYERSLKYFQSALVIVSDIGDRNSQGTALNNIGSSYNRLGKYSEALDNHQQALAIHQATSNRAGESTVLNNLAEDYTSLKQYDRVLPLRRKALEIAKEIGDRSSEAIFTNNIGDDYWISGKVEQSLTYYRAATEIARKVKYRELEGLSLTSEGKALDRLNRLPEAEVQLRSAITIWESLRVGLVDKDKISLQNRIKYTYDLLQQVLIKQNKIPAALEVAERGRARVLAELLASKIRTTNSATTQKLKQAPNLSRIQQIARAQKATLVEYSTLDDRILIWVIKPTGKITFHQSKLPPKTTLKDLVVATRDSIKASRGRRSKDDSPKTTGGDLKQLHKLLIAPIAQDLPKTPEERVIILPQNELFLVPFAALQDAQGRYLIQQHTITIAPSIQVLSLTERRSITSNIPPLIVGNPIMPLYNGEQLPSLLGAEAEATAVSKILQVEPLIGAQAEKKKVIELMRRAPLIHLATHGVMDTIKGDIPGAIALTNGFLTSGEIFDMELSADLVVLSACNTGRGGTDVDVTGEGVVGLSRSLSVAGVPSVLVSLWEVDDAATKVLMEEFYHNLRDQKLTKAQALRQAMLTTMKSYPDPNLWAAFMLVGEGR